MELVVDFNRGNFDKVINNDLGSYFGNMDVLITIREANDELWIGSNFHQVFIRDLFYRLDRLYKNKTPFYIETWGNGDFYYFCIYKDSMIIEKNNKEKIMCSSRQFQDKLIDAMDNYFSKLLKLNPSVVNHVGYTTLRDYTMWGHNSD